MGTLSSLHWIVLFFSGVLFVPPGWRILQRTGFSGAWALVALIPIVNILLLWVFAFSRWPREQQGGA